MLALEGEAALLAGGGFWRRVRYSRGVHSLGSFLWAGPRELQLAGAVSLDTHITPHFCITRTDFALKYKEILGGLCNVQKLERLQEERKRSRLTQEELARISGVSRVSIARLETGATRAKPETARKLARALKVEPEELV